MLELTNAERGLVESTREEFGEPLTQFLLAGLGEQELGQRWRFTISYVDGEGTRLKRRIQVISHEPEDGSSCLPRGRDPLVFLALLQLFIRNTQASDHGLVYDLEDVLKLLGWGNAQKSRREIDEAIKRYFLMIFKWGKNRAELAREKLSHYTTMERPVSECGTVDDEVDGEMKRVFNKVIFNRQFIEHLKQRSLFEIEWNSVQTVSRTIQR